MVNKKSKWWSEADVKQIYAFINEAKNEKKTLWAGCEKAAEHFGVTAVAVYQRYLKCERKKKHDGS